MLAMTKILTLFTGVIRWVFYYTVVLATKYNDIFCPTCYTAFNSLQWDQDFERVSSCNCQYPVEIIWDLKSPHTNLTALIPYIYEEFMLIFKLGTRRNCVPRRVLIPPDTGNLILTAGRWTAPNKSLLCSTSFVPVTSGEVNRSSDS